MYAVITCTPISGHPEELGEIKRLDFVSRQAAEEAAQKASSEGKRTLIIRLREPHRFTVGPSAIVEDIEWR
jgi:hypothetical protein